MVDYTERRKTAREKRKNVCFHIIITCGPPQREELLRKILGGGFLNFIKQNYTDFEEERLREKSFCMFSPLHHRAPTTERRNIKRKKNETVFKFH